MHTIRALAATSMLLCSVAFAAEPAAIAVTAQPIPEGTMTRAQLVVMVVDQLYPNARHDACFKELSPSDYWLLFSDVSVRETYAPSLCFAMKNGLVRGYPDGTFRPDRPVNFAETSKILSRAFALSPDVYSPVPGQPWYQPPVAEIAARNAIPKTVTSFSHPVSGVEAYEMVYRLANADASRPSTTYAQLQSGEAKGM